MIFLIILIILAISIYMKNSYFVEGVENMFNDKGQFSEFILPEYCPNSPLTQLTETIFFDKKNGNIVEAVVEWTTQNQHISQISEEVKDIVNNAGPAMNDNVIAEEIATAIRSIASETENSSEEEIKAKVTEKINQLLASNIPEGIKDDITANKEEIINEITEVIKTNGPNLPANVLDAIPTVKTSLSRISNIVNGVESNLSSDATATAPATAPATADAPAPAAGGAGNEQMTTMYEGHENMGSQTPTLKQLLITPRNGGESYIYDIENTPECVKKPTQESLNDTIDTTCGCWSYVSVSEFAPETTVFYMPWKTETYLAIYENSEGNMNARGVFHFSKEKNQVVNINSVEMTNYINTQDDNNNKYVKDEKYGDHDLYQVDKFVLYDIPTSNLIVRKEHNTGSINIYNGSGETMSQENVNELYSSNKTHENQEKFAELKAWSVLDGQGENTIIYIKNVDKTVVAVCGFESSTMDSFVLKNVKRFTLYGMDTCDKIEKPTPACDAKTETEPAKEEKKEETKTTEPTSEDYILKTQIVPPVCPSCPMCPGDVTCSNCGGNGGCGTKDKDGKSMVKDEPKKEVVKQVVDQNGNIISETVGEVTDLARDTATGAVDLGKETVGGAVGLGRETVGGALGLGREIVGGTVGLGREIVGGATGLVGNIAGGITGLVRDAGSGAVSVLTPQQQQMQQQQQRQGGRMAYQQVGGSQGQYYGTNNNYTRYGALPEKQSYFIPRTADFSAFA